MRSQHPIQRKHSIILAPFLKTIGYIFPVKNCWPETTEEESVSVTVAGHSPQGQRLMAFPGLLSAGPDAEHRG